VGLVINLHHLSAIQPLKNLSPGSLDPVSFRFVFLGRLRSEFNDFSTWPKVINQESRWGPFMKKANF
jgi:hypothetical protein